MELNIIQQSIEEVAERRKLSFSKCQELIDQVSRETEQALCSVQSDNDPTTVLTELKTKLQALVSDNHLEGPYQEVDMILSKRGEDLEKMLFPDISKALTKVKFDPHTVNQIVISHFYREGLFDVADCLINEAREPEPTLLRLQFQEIHPVVKAVKAKNIDPAFNWIAANQERLKESYSDLELKLHKIRFVDILQNKDRHVALKYAKNFIAPLASRHMKETQKLMGSLLWAGRLEISPYGDLLKPIHRENLADELLRAFCNLNGQPNTDPLKVSVAAGGEALPTLLKTTDIMIKNEHLPIEVELGKEFQFHSVFFCPVTYQQSTQENPAMMLPCGHCLCSDTIKTMPTDEDEDGENFKCPFCFRKVSVSDCLQLYY